MGGFCDGACVGSILCHADAPARFLLASKPVCSSGAAERTDVRFAWLLKQDGIERGLRRKALFVFSVGIADGARRSVESTLRRGWKRLDPSSELGQGTLHFFTRWGGAKLKLVPESA